MGDLFFIFRMMVYTVLLVFLMQIKIGTTTIEEKVIHWTQTSSFSQILQEVAAGGQIVLGQGVENIKTKIKTKTNEISDTIKSSK